MLEIWVKYLPSAMALFVRQYMDRVWVLEPEDVAKKAEDTLRRDFKTYFLENFLEMRTIIVCKCAIYNYRQAHLENGIEQRI